MRAVVSMMSAVLLTSCMRTPDSYGIPPQHEPVEMTVGSPRTECGEYVSSNDAHAESYIVRDIKQLEASAWRWTYAEPELRFVVRSAAGRTLHVEFGINDRTFRD